MAWVYESHVVIKNLSQFVCLSDDCFHFRFSLSSSWRDEIIIIRPHMMLYYPHRLKTSKFVVFINYLLYLCKYDVTAFEFFFHLWDDDMIWQIVSVDVFIANAQILLLALQPFSPSTVVKSSLSKTSCEVLRSCTLYNAQRGTAGNSVESEYRYSFSVWYFFTTPIHSIACWDWLSSTTDLHNKTMSLIANG